MTTATHPPARGGPKRTGPAISRVQQDAIEGRYRPITTHQLTLAWWLYDSKHITKRQLRVWFASHEMAERRFYTASEKQGCADFSLEEIKALVGGRGSKTADRDLSADVKRLGELGLVKIARRSITFAETVEQVAVDDTDGFFRMWDQMDHRTRGRSVPVPRRTLRELAAGFTTGSSAYLIAALIRCVFWRRKERCYNTDGRIKDVWVAETFGVGLTAVRQGRRRLQELGLLEKRDGLAQWNLNRYGSHIVVHCDWSRNTVSGTTVSVSGSQPNAVDNPNTSAVGEGRSAAKSDTPPAQNSGQSATPCLNRSASPTENINTRKPRATAPGPAGVSRTKGSDQKSKAASTAPNIRDVQPADLKCPEALQELYRQAVASGFACSSGAGELNFFALANRARTRGNRPGALFISNLKKGRSHFITIEDEEVGRRMLTKLRDGPQEPRSAPKKPERRLSDEERIVEICLQQAKRVRGFEGFDLARRAKGWTRDQWDRAEASYTRTQARQWYSADEFETDLTPFAGLAR